MTRGTLSVDYAPPPQNPGDVVIEWGSHKINCGRGVKARLVSETILTALDVLEEGLRLVKEEDNTHE